MLLRRRPASRSTSPMNPSMTSSPKRRWLPTPDRGSTWCGGYIRCRICSRKNAVDVTDVADYLGKKYGGWAPSGVAYGKRGTSGSAFRWQRAGGLVNYRVAAMQKCGFKEFPKDLGGFRELIKGLESERHACGHGARPRNGDANGWLAWAMWAHNAYTVDKNNKVIVNSPETAKALEYVKSLYENFNSRRGLLDDSSNNKAFLAGSFTSPLTAFRSMSRRRRKIQRSQPIWITRICRSGSAARSAKQHLASRS
jgi:hypothetical protein